MQNLESLIIGKLIKLILFIPLLLVISHIIIIRTIRLLKIRMAAQLTIAFVIMAFNLLMLFLALKISKGLLLSNRIFLFVYTALVYNCLAYIYFHFFNLLITGRRIRFLLLIKQGKKLEDFDNDNKFMISDRIERLIGTGQIVINNAGKYVIKNKTLLIVSNIIRQWRKIIRLPENK